MRLLLARPAPPLPTSRLPDDCCGVGIDLQTNHSEGIDAGNLLIEAKRNMDFDVACGFSTKARNRVPA